MGNTHTAAICARKMQTLDRVDFTLVRMLTLNVILIVARNVLKEISLKKHTKNRKILLSINIVTEETCLISEQVLGTEFLMTEQQPYTAIFAVRHSILGKAIIFARKQTKTVISIVVRTATKGATLLESHAIRVNYFSLAILRGKDTMATLQFAASADKR
jgi:hypothetical protein